MPGNRRPRLDRLPHSRGARARAAPRGSSGFGERSLDLWVGGVSLAVFGESHPVVGREPPIIAPARGKPVQQFQQRSFLPWTAGIADQAVGERSGGEDDRIGIARHQQAEKCDMALFPLIQAEAIDARASAASPRSNSACALAAWARAKPGSAVIARSKASIAPGYMVSFASRPSTYAFGAAEDVADKRSPHGSVNMIGGPQPWNSPRKDTIRLVARGRAFKPRKGQGCVSCLRDRWLRTPSTAVPFRVGPDRDLVSRFLQRGV
jgi:hypothetical protein